MDISDPTPKPNATRGCLIVAVVAGLVVAGLGTVVYLKLLANEREFERKQAERRVESFEKVRAGDNGEGIPVFLDPRLIEMLASDPDCIANLTTLNLSTVDLNGPQTASAGKLVN